MNKKLIAGCLTLLLCVVLVACAPSDNTEQLITPTPVPTGENPADIQVGDAVVTSSPESFLYENHNIGFSMQIPTSWRGKYSKEENENTYDGGITIKSIEVYHNATRDELGTGFLFSIGQAVGEEFTKDNPPVMAGQTTFLAQAGGYTYYINFPENVQYNENPGSESAAEYKEMKEQVDVLVDTFTLIERAADDEEQFVYMFDDAEFIEISWAYSDGHNGINITSNYNNSIYQAPIKSVCDGTVVYLVNNNKTAGNYVVIETSDGIKVGYMLMDEPTTLKVGDTVEKGKTIVGYVGKSGNATGPNLLISFFKTEPGDKDEFWPRTHNSLDPEEFFPNVDFITR